MDAIIKNGRVERGYLGALIQNLTPEMAESFGFERKSGVLIGDVSKDGPAHEVGLKAGDIITKLNDKSMENSSHLDNAVAVTAPNTEVKLEVLRSGRRRTVKVKLACLEEVVAGGALPVGKAAVEELGITVRTLTPELASQLVFDDDQRGVVITEVKTGEWLSVRACARRTSSYRSTARPYSARKNSRRR